MVLVKSPIFLKKFTVPELYYPDLPNMHGTVITIIVNLEKKSEKLGVPKFEDLTSTETFDMKNYLYKFL